jgi:hypothetical protein
MARKKGKPISFDAMVKFFLHTYEIPTTRDVDKLMARLARLESLIAAVPAVVPAGRSKGARRKGVPAAEAVLETIKRSKQGLKFADIQTKTGFADKKIRNIIFRLNKLGKIKRHSRGVYIAIG